MGRQGPAPTTPAGWLPLAIFLTACGQGGGAVDGPQTSGGTSSASGTGGDHSSAGGSAGTASGGDGGAGSASGGATTAGSGGTTGDGGEAGDGGLGGQGVGGSPQPGSGGSSMNDRSSCKRGVAYGHHSVADLQALSAGVSWWYNWDFRPEEALRGGAYRDAQVEYVPMIWGEGSDREQALSAIPSGTQSLLGFNEPNFGAQANLSAQAAAALWPELEALGDALDLRLVSPAVNFCGGDCQDTDPFHYLHEFFAACDGCRVDAVAFHIYVGCSPSGPNKAEWLIGHIEKYKQEFEQPLWLTEFACDSAASMDEQQAFLEDAVAYLEAEPRIERYAWFAGRADNVAHVDLLGGDGELTPLGQAYVNAPQAEGCAR